MKTIASKARVVRSKVENGTYHLIKQVRRFGAWIAFCLSLLWALKVWIVWRCRWEILSENCRFALASDVYDFQTLIAGGLALAAAGITLRATRKQLMKVNIQSSVMARNVLVDRVRLMEKRKHATKKLLTEVTQKFFGALFPTGYEDEPSINEHWAFDAEHEATMAKKFLANHQERKLDARTVEAARALLIDRVQRLVNCLDSIHRPASTDHNEITENQMEKLERDAASAKLVLVERIQDVSEQADALDKSFAASMEQLRSSIRRIDDLIVSDELTDH